MVVSLFVLSLSYRVQGTLKTKSENLSFMLAVLSVIQSKDHCHCLLRVRVRQSVRVWTGSQEGRCTMTQKTSAPMRSSSRSTRAADGRLRDDRSQSSIRDVMISLPRSSPHPPAGPHQGTWRDGTRWILLAARPSARSMLPGSPPGEQTETPDSREEQDMGSRLVADDWWHAAAQARLATSLSMTTVSKSKISACST